MDETSASAVFDIERDPPGIVSALGELNPCALISEKGIASLFGRCPRSIQRAVERGELPPPIRMLGQKTWTARSILDHITGRLEKEALNRDQIQRKIRKLES